MTREKLEVTFYLVGMNPAKALINAEELPTFLKAVDAIATALLMNVKPMIEVRLIQAS